ncbi:hypothetical protein B2M20_08175 [Nitrobacter vulgaris]|jgi:hypothetical protein|uniref:Uncharacterized protein n=1 Tax=Nitrobacter vulgaris TaxID=29421 RepID=A0A1V4HZF0_NITVU|nr:hypothetical protein B2M20_08175 [Nitrobacter vulgaris]
MLVSKLKPRDKIATSTTFVTVFSLYKAVDGFRGARRMLPDTNRRACLAFVQLRSVGGTLPSLPRFVGQKVHTLASVQAFLFPSLTLLVGSRDECKATLSAHCFAHSGDAFFPQRISR